MFFPKKKAVVLSFQDLTNNCLQRWFKRMKKNIANCQNISYISPYQGKYSKLRKNLKMAK